MGCSFSYPDLICWERVSSRLRATRKAEMATEHEDYCLHEYKYLYSPDILQGKVALVTGGGSGICFRIAEVFMRHGCDTVIASRKMSKLKEVLSNKQAHPSKA